MVPPTPLASLSSLADRFATIIHHRQGPYLTPGNQIVIQIPGCFLFGRSRNPIFTCDRNQGKFSRFFFYLPPRKARPAPTIALAAALTLGPI